MAHDCRRLHSLLNYPLISFGDFFARHSNSSAPTPQVISAPVPISHPSATSPDKLTPTTPNFDSLVIDVPAWLELMHRSGRKRVLAYVVRATPRIENDNDEGFISLRTGRDLTPILQLRRTVSANTSAVITADKSNADDR